MSGGTASMSGRTSGKHRLTGAKIALKRAKTTNLKGSRDMVDETNNHQDVYSIQTVDLKVQVWDTSRGVSQIVWTQSAKLEQTKENK